MVLVEKLQCDAANRTVDAEFTASALELPQRIGGAVAALQLTPRVVDRLGSGREGGRGGGGGGFVKKKQECF